MSPGEFALEKNKNTVRPSRELKGRLPTRSSARLEENGSKISRFMLTNKGSLLENRVKNGLANRIAEHPGLTSHASKKLPLLKGFQPINNIVFKSSSVWRKLDLVWSIKHVGRYRSRRTMGNKGSFFSSYNQQELSDVYSFIPGQEKSESRRDGGGIKKPSVQLSDRVLSRGSVLQSRRFEERSRATLPVQREVNDVSDAKPLPAVRQEPDVKPVPGEAGKSYEISIPSESVSESVSGGGVNGGNNTVDSKPTPLSILQATNSQGKGKQTEEQSIPDSTQLKAIFPMESLDATRTANSKSNEDIQTRRNKVRSSHRKERTLVLRNKRSRSKHERNPKRVFGTTTLPLSTNRTEENNLPISAMGETIVPAQKRSVQGKAKPIDLEVVRGRDREREFIPEDEGTTKQGRVGVSGDVSVVLKNDNPSIHYHSSSIDKAIRQGTPGIPDPVNEDGEQTEIPIKKTPIRPETRGNNTITGSTVSKRNVVYQDYPDKGRNTPDVEKGKTGVIKALPSTAGGENISRLPMLARKAPVISSPQIIKKILTPLNLITPQDDSFKYNTQNKKETVFTQITKELVSRRGKLGADKPEVVYTKGMPKVAMPKAAFPIRGREKGSLPDYVSNSSGLTPEGVYSQTGEEKKLLGEESGQRRISLGIFSAKLPELQGNTEQEYSMIEVGSVEDRSEGRWSYNSETSEPEAKLISSARPATERHIRNNLQSKDAAYDTLSKSRAPILSQSAGKGSRGKYSSEYLPVEHRMAEHIIEKYSLLGPTKVKHSQFEPEERKLNPRKIDTMGYDPVKDLSILTYRKVEEKREDGRPESPEIPATRTKGNREERTNDGISRHATFEILPGSNNKQGLIQAKPFILATGRQYMTRDNSKALSWYDNKIKEKDNRLPLLPQPHYSVETPIETSDIYQTIMSGFRSTGPNGRDVLTQSVLKLPVVKPAAPRIEARDTVIEVNSGYAGSVSRSGLSRAQSPASFSSVSTNNHLPPKPDARLLEQDSDSDSDERSSEMNGQPDIKALAREVYPLIKRMIMLEKERRPF